MTPAQIEQCLSCTSNLWSNETTCVPLSAFFERTDLQKETLKKIIVKALEANDSDDENRSEDDND